MPPKKSQSNPTKKPVKKIKVLQLKTTKQKSLLSEYFHLFLGILLAGITLLFAGFGMRLDEAALIGVWVAGIIFVARQAVRFFKDEPAPKKQEKRPLAELPSKKYTPPALPRVSKDFRPMPPEGDKRYPPPSPFIKPPK
jgi:hypothetical protein